MSVLIEALALVVRRSELEARYPGGPEAFLEAARGLEQPPRFACAGDEHLVSLGFYDAGQVGPCLELLLSHGLDEVQAGSWVAAVCVDQDLGPTTACPWLAWARAERVTCAWLTGTEAGDMATDEGWTVERSQGVVRREQVDSPGRLVRLAEERGLETWLDLQTGRQLVGRARLSDAGAGAGDEGQATAFLCDAALEPPRPDRADDGDEDGDAEDRVDQERIAHLRRRIVEVLEAEDLRFGARNRWWVEVPITAESVHVTVRIGPSENGNLLRLYTTTDMRVPAEHRPAACEVLTRANYGLPAGNFEMDLRDGEVAFKGSLFLAEDGEFTDAQLGAAIRGGVFVYERYYAALMRVIYGGASPAEAIEEVEG